jgi:hypothetical protein
LARELTAPLNPGGAGRLDDEGINRCAALLETEHRARRQFPREVVTEPGPGIDVCDEIAGVWRAYSLERALAGFLDEDEARVVEIVDGGPHLDAAKGAVGRERTLIDGQ